MTDAILFNTNKLCLYLEMGNWLERSIWDFNAYINSYSYIWFSLPSVLHNVSQHVLFFLQPLENFLINWWYDGGKNTDSFLLVSYKNMLNSSIQVDKGTFFARLILK